MTSQQLAIISHPFLFLIAAMESMETLVQRVRGVMNLLLIWALILFWVATVESVDIYKLCHNLEMGWIKLYATARNGGIETELSLAKPKGPSLTPEQKALLSKFKHQTSALSSIRYRSLRSDNSSKPKAAVQKYLAGCRETLQTVQQGVANKHPGFVTADTQALATAVESMVSELNWHVERLELGPNATLADVAREARPRISIPGTGQSLPMAGGVALSIIGLSCVYFYFVSLLRTLRDSLSATDVEFTREWVFLHPGWLGPLLGLAWLSLPMVALFFAGRAVFSSQAVDSVYALPLETIFLLPVGWLWAVVGAVRTRLAANHATKQSFRENNTAELRLAKHLDSEHWQNSRSRAA